MSSLRNTRCRWKSIVFGTEKQRGADLLVRLAFRRLQRDLQFLRRELVALPRLAAPQPLACGAQLGGRALGPRAGAQPVELVVRATQLDARVHAAARAPQALPEAQLRPGEAEGVVSGMEIERVGERRLEVVIAREQIRRSAR